MTKLFMSMPKNQRGQSTVEAILIMVLLVSVAISVSNVFREKKYLASLVSGPWQYVAGMVENGIWLPPDKAKSYHPSHIGRHSTPTEK